MTKSNSIVIDNKSVGETYPCFIIAEIAQAHDGSLGAAHAYIDAVAETGVDAIKFQTHIASEESTLQEPFRAGHFPQDETRYDYWQRMEFTAEQWSGLAAHARDKKLLFLSTPFSIAAVELLLALDIPAWKTGSGEIDNLPMLEVIASSGKPVLLSSGMSSWSELDKAVTLLESHKSPHGMFQCTSSYPCQAEELGLNIIHEMKQRYSCPVGLSDHTGNIFSALAAVNSGANMIEVHTVFSRDCFGPDVSSSITITELKQMVEGVRFIERAMNNPVDKNQSAAEREDLKKIFGKSLVAARDIESGRALNMRDIVMKKPGTGIPARRMGEIVGQSLNRNYKKGEFFEEDSFNKH